MAGNENYYIILENLKEKIRIARQKAALVVNAELLGVYWEIGNEITLQEKKEGWGAGTIEKLSKDLRSEFPDIKGFSPRYLRYMREFASAWPHFPNLQDTLAKTQEVKNQSDIILQAPIAKLTWYHHITLLDKVKDPKNRLFYLYKTIENGWSRNVLVHQIESQLHLRQGNAITSFENTLPKSQSDLAKETLKNPYIFDFLGLTEEIQERELEKALIQHIKKFMLELGRGFAYVGNQYNLNVEGDDYFLDLLFYNYHLHCFVVFELKVGDFKPEFAGKLNFYVNTVNQQIKGKADAPTIGVLLCKTPNDTVVKYSLHGIDNPMGVAEYELTKFLPKELKGKIPTIEELEKEMEQETHIFKEQLSVVDKRLQAIKDKVKDLKSDEIQISASNDTLQVLFTNGLQTLYEKLVTKLAKDFEEEFVSKSFYWSILDKTFYKIAEVKELWEKEENLKKGDQLDFVFKLHGFKKGGPNDFSEYLTLRFEWKEYWYGFTLLNHNNQQPFLKKLYHQPITKEDQQQIIDLMMTKIMDKIDWIVEVIKNKQES